MFYSYNFKATGLTLRERCLGFAEYLGELLRRHSSHGQNSNLIISEEVGVIFQVIDAFDEQLKLHHDNPEIFGCYYVEANKMSPYEIAFVPQRIDIHASRAIKPSYLILTGPDGVHTIKLDGFLKSKEKAN